MFGAAGGERDMVYVRLSNNTTRGIPLWMFDEVVCASVRSAEQPTIDCHALLRLAQLLDSQGAERRNAEHEHTPHFSRDSAPAASPPSTAPAAPRGGAADRAQQ